MAHETRTHAVLSASASKRWLSCPPSAKLNAELPDTTSEYAREGTCAHELAEYKVNKLLGVEAKDPTENLDFYDSEMEDCTDSYAQYISEQMSQPVQVVDTANGEEIPENILAALADENVIKRAFNVNFERVCLSKYLRENYPQYFQSYSIAEDTVGDYLDPKGWHCSMIHARTLGLPSSLAEVGSVLGIEQQKMTEGKALIKFFCTPYDAIDGVPQFHSPKDYPEKWEIFKAYNKRDVEAEMEIDKKLSRFPVPDFLWEEFYLDQEINDRGILVDMKLADAAIGLDAEAKEELATKMQRLTGVENPNSVYQLLDWLESRGYKPDSLGKAQVKELIKTAEEPVKSVLEMRLQLSKSSVKKYTAMKQTACRDHRARGMFSFYGASRTGRWAGRNIQLQNLPQNHLEDLTEARELVKTGSFDDVQMIYDDVPDTLSQLIRTAFIPRPGMKFIVADFSAIEARVIAWLADEQWRMDAFANGEDIYCASASKMFGVPVVKHGVNGHLRQKGKVAELACGYGGSVGAMKAMGADSLGLSDTELKQIVTDWRDASPHITELWWSVDRAVKKAVKEKTVTETHGLTFSYEAGFVRSTSDFYSALEQAGYKRKKTKNGVMIYGIAIKIDFLD